jgi:hypothetical protein
MMQLSGWLMFIIAFLALLGMLDIINLTYNYLAKRFDFKALFYKFWEMIN